MAYIRRDYLFIYAVLPSYVGDMDGALCTMPMLHPEIFFERIP